MKKIAVVLLATLIVASAFVLMSFSTTALGATYTAVQASMEPNINDGKLDDVYKSSTKITFMTGTDNKNTKNDSFVYFCHYNGNLYLYASIKDTDGKKGSENYGATVENWKKTSYLTDCFEVYLDLMPSDPTNGCDRKDYSAQLRVNPWYTVTKLDLPENEYADKLGLALHKESGKMTDLLGVAAGKSVAKVFPNGNSYVVEMKINLEGTAESEIGIGLQIQEGEKANLLKWESQLNEFGENPKYWSTNLFETLKMPGFQSNAAITAEVEAAAKAASDAAVAKAKADSDLAASKAAAKASSEAVSSEEPTSAATVSDSVSSSSEEMDVAVQNEQDTTAPGTNVWLIVGIVGGVLVLAAAAVGVVLWQRKKKQ